MGLGGGGARERAERGCRRQARRRGGEQTAPGQSRGHRQGACSRTLGPAAPVSAPCVGQRGLRSAAEGRVAGGVREAEGIAAGPANRNVAPTGTVGGGGQAVCSLRPLWGVGESPLVVKDVSPCSRMTAVRAGKGVWGPQLRGHAFQEAWGGVPRSLQSPPPPPQGGAPDLVSERACSHRGWSCSSGGFVSRIQVQL